MTTNNKPISEKDGRKITRDICDLLEKEYGIPEPVDPQEPLEDVIESILAENVGRKKAERSMHELRRRFVDWNEMRVSWPGEIAETIGQRPDGREAAIRIKNFLESVCQELQELSLKFLLELTQKEAAPYLNYLEKADPDAAAYLKIRSLGIAAVPLSPELRRVSDRIGLTLEEWDADEARERLEKVLPKEITINFCQLAVEHAEVVCVPNKPACAQCVLRKDCRYGSQRTRKTGSKNEDTEKVETKQ